MGIKKVETMSHRLYPCLSICFIDYLFFLRRAYPAPRAVMISNPLPIGASKSEDEPCTLGKAMPFSKFLYTSSLSALLPKKPSFTVSPQTSEGFFRPNPHGTLKRYRRSIRFSLSMVFRASADFHAWLFPLLPL